MSVFQPFREKKRLWGHAARTNVKKGLSMSSWAMNNFCYYSAAVEVVVGVEAAVG